MFHRHAQMKCALSENQIKLYQNKIVNSPNVSTQPFPFPPDRWPFPTTCPVIHFHKVIFGILYFFTIVLMEMLSAPTVLHLLENKKDRSRSKCICKIKSGKFRNDFTVDQ